MASTVERTAEGIIYKSAREVAVPDLDLLTLLFESEYCHKPDDTIIHVDAEDPSNHLTKAELRRQSKLVACVLRDQYGIGASASNQDVVFTMSTGHFMLPVLFYGTVAAEGVFSAASPSATPRELAAQLRQTDATLLICNRDTKKASVEAAKLAGLPLSRVVLYQGEKVIELYEAVSGAKVPISNQELHWRRVTDAQDLDNSVICLLFSSGTTGIPKAMKLSHRNMVAASYLILEPIKKFNAANRPPGFRYASLAHLPIAHIAGAQGYFSNCLYMGGPLYWMPRFDFAKFCEYIRKYEVTSMFSVPPIYLLLSKSPAVNDHFQTWVDAVSGAAPMGEDLQHEASKKLGCGKTRVRQTWGLSETTGSITIVPLDHAHIAPGTVGSMVTSHQARIIDGAGKDVEPGQEGEVLVRGPVVVKGYWRNQKANDEAFRNGWFYTGDIGVVRDGWFYIVDRKKELIKYKAAQVAPAELEAVLLSHPKILDAAVIGVPGEGTELPRAYVVADEKQISADEIKDFVASHVAQYKQLRGGVFYISAIPKSASGKILRKDLRELAQKDQKISKL